MFDLPQIEGSLNEENRISQAKQTSFTYHQVIASARSAVLKYRTTGCNLISTHMKMKSTVQVLHVKGSNRKTQSPVSDDRIYSSQIGL